MRQTSNPYHHNEMVEGKKGAEGEHLPPWGMPKDPAIHPFRKEKNPPGPSFLNHPYPHPLQGESRCDRLPEHPIYASFCLQAVLRLQTQTAHHHMA